MNIPSIVYYSYITKLFLINGCLTIAMNVCKMMQFWVTRGWSVHPRSEWQTPVQVPPKVTTLVSVSASVNNRTFK